MISTGEFKGAGAPGAPVTTRQLEVFQEEIDDLNVHFLAGVSDALGAWNVTLAESLRGAGFSTAAFSGNPFLDPQWDLWPKPWDCNHQWLPSGTSCVGSRISSCINRTGKYLYQCGYPGDG